MCVTDKKKLSTSNVLAKTTKSKLVSQHKNDTAVILSKLATFWYQLQEKRVSICHTRAKRSAMVVVFAYNFCCGLWLLFFASYVTGVCSAPKIFVICKPSQPEK